MSSSVTARLILFQEVCPALHAILEDGLKPEVITSFGRMTTSAWRVVEAVTRQTTAVAANFDLVMMLNAKFANDEHRKFAGFVVGLLK
jgi:hypothetical protein